MYYLTCTEYYYTSTECISNWNESVTGHKQKRDGLFQLKQLPRSSGKSSVSISTKALINP